MKIALVTILVVQGTLCTLVSTVAGWQLLFDKTWVKGNELTIPILGCLGAVLLSLAYLVHYVDAH